MGIMESFREFEAGPDPFGRVWRVRFKWQQNAISLRHSDSVDVKFALSTGSGGEGEREEKTVALMNLDLQGESLRSGHAVTDPWVSRLAARHLRCAVETGEDMEKDLLVVSAERLGEHSRELSRVGR
jgi:hypothetical protein